MDGYGAALVHGASHERKTGANDPRRPRSPVPLVGMAVTAQVRSGGPDGFVCTVAGVGGAGTSTALLPRANAYTLAAGAAPRGCGPVTSSRLW